MAPPSKYRRIHEAEQWLRGAAEQGAVGGMLFLGLVLRESGRAAEAERWLRGAADERNPDAMYSLALLVQEAGREAEAAQWYRRAAANGSANAEARLRRMGQGGPAPST